MSRAKQRAGIPLDLIQPKKKAPPTPPVRMKPVFESQHEPKNKWSTRKWNTSPEDPVSRHPNRVDRDTHFEAHSEHQSQPKLQRFDPSTHRVHRQLSLTDSDYDGQSRNNAYDRRNDQADHYAIQGKDHDSLEDEAEAEAMRRIQEMMHRKPAGLTERLVKVAKIVKQPIDPHLLRISVIGAANAGKSTLVNALVGESVSVVSPKAHTTRERVAGVLSESNYQLIFLDTPGVVPDNRHARMNRTLVTSSWRSLDEADHVALVLDSHWVLSPNFRQTEEYLLSRLKSVKLPISLIFNKIDLLEERGQLESIAKKFQKECPTIQNILQVSALTGEGLDKIKKALFSASKPNQWLYPLEMKNDMPDLKRVEELIRVEFFKRLHQYIPYMLKQENIGWTELPNGGLRIDQNVYVERESQLKIVVGSNGAIINRVVADAKAQISKALKRPVQLYIQVKTKKR